MYQVVTRIYKQNHLHSILWFGTRLYVRDQLTLTLGAASCHGLS